LPDVFRVDPSIPGQVDYTLTFDPEPGAWVDFFPGPVGEPSFDFSRDGESSLVGTIPNGAWAVAVDAEDWTITLGPRE